MGDDSFPMPHERRPRWARPFTWLGLLALGWAVYELTSRPALGAVAVCVKFGWEDFQTARWLWRTDPDRGRGQACFWLYLASGLWKTAVVAFVMSMAFTAVTPRAGNGPPPAGAADALLAFAGTVSACLIGLLLSAAATALAVRLAWRRGVRLWLGSAAHRARRGNFWPP